MLVRDKQQDGLIVKRQQSERHGDNTLHLRKKVKICQPMKSALTVHTP